MGFRLAGLLVGLGWVVVVIIVVHVLFALFGGSFSGWDP